jgi:hypothetical protein
MKLTAVDVVNDLKELQLGEVCLFSESSKSISLIVRENDTPQIAVKLKKEVHYFSFNERDKAQELFDKSFVITDEIYNNPDKLIDFIMNCEVDVKYRYSDLKRSIQIDSKNDDGCFSWIYSNGWNNTFPMKNANYIQTFKTEKGARLSLIKHLGLKS